MITKQDGAEIIQTFDLNEISTKVTLPAKVVHVLIKDIINTEFDHPQRIMEINSAVGEMIQDVDIHGDESCPRLVFVRREMGGIAIDTVNRIKPNNSVRYGLGHLLLSGLFGNDYSNTIEGDLFENHLFISEDFASSEIPHCAKTA